MVGRVRLVGIAAEIARCCFVAERREQSVANGLSALADIVSDQDWMLVHDAARPCLSQAMLNDLYDALRDDPVGGLLAVPVADTLKRADADQRVMDTEPREACGRRRRRKCSATDCCGNPLPEIPPSPTKQARLKRQDGSRVWSRPMLQFQDTFPADLRLAELVLQGRES